MSVRDERRPPADKAAMEKLAVLVGDRPNARDKRAVRHDEFEAMVLKIINKWAKDKGLI